VGMCSGLEPYYLGCHRAVPLQYLKRQSNISRSERRKIVVVIVTVDVVKYERSSMIIIIIIIIIIMC
jgi:hypothetical protein